MAIMNHDIDGAPVAIDPSKLLGRIVLIWLAVYAVIVILQAVTSDENIWLIIFTTGLFMVFLIVPILSVFNYRYKYNRSGKFNDRQQWILNYLAGKGHQIDLKTKTANLYIDSQQRKLFCTSLYENKLKECDFSDIRRWSKKLDITETTHMNKDKAYSHTTEETKMRWLILQLKDVENPTAKVQFGSESELDEWIQKLDVLLNHS